MGRFILKRLLHMIPILLGVSLLTFLLMSLAPGDYFTTLSQNPQVSPGNALPETQGAIPPGPAVVCPILLLAEKCA